MKIKQLLLPLVAALCFANQPSAAQGTPEAKKNVLRVGTGISRMYQYDRNYWGPIWNVEYSRELNKYLAVSLQGIYSYRSPDKDDTKDILVSQLDNYHKGSNINTLGISPTLIVTPLPKHFRFVKLGVGAAYEYAHINASTYHYTKDIPGAAEIYCRYRLSYYGFNTQARLYILDNNYLEIFGMYDQQFLYRQKCWHTYPLITINLGIKF